jgi:hypothetical protein
LACLVGFFFALMASLLRSLLILPLLIAPLVYSEESAWNGHVFHTSNSSSRFTPYYVPPGARSYDSTSPLIHYSGKWTEIFSQAYIHSSVRRTNANGAYVSFTFFGTGVEWFGNSDKTNGRANVYIDGKLVQRVNACSSEPMSQQRLFWIYDLPFAKHTIKIVNAGKHKGPARLDLDALVITTGISKNIEMRSTPVLAVSDRPPAKPLARESPPTSQWTLIQKGSTGVHAMQLAVISDTHALIVDKVEHNPLTISGHPAWAALYDLRTHTVKPLKMQSNSFCAGGSFIGNGTLINVGGNPVVEDHTSAADFGDLNGLQAIRILEPCDSDSAGGCVMRENHSRTRMASPRWYNTVVRISDGSAMIIGGSKRGGWINNATVNNPTIEYWPPKNIHGSNGLPIPLPFLVDTLNANLFPISFALLDGKVFMAANRDAMIYDWRSNTERRLPPIPNGVRVTYPMTGTGLLLPLSPANQYAPEILLCGGSTLDDKKPCYELSSQNPASAQCSRMVLTEDGIAAGWQVEQMPEARIMPDAVLLPTGQVLIVNGAQSGISGYSNVRDQVGASNAANPAFRPVLYDPYARAGERFSTRGMPASRIPRLYHSVATLTPSGDVMVAGSNPNLDRSEVMYGTEYRVEWVRPPYMGVERPTIDPVGGKRVIGFGQKVVFRVDVPASLAATDVKGSSLHSRVLTRLIFLICKRTQWR